MLQIAPRRTLATVILLATGLSACETQTDEPSAAQQALDELQSKYNELLKDKVDVPVEWAAEDLENIGDWEYKVINMSFKSPEDFETQLNDFGNDRWEVIWLEETPQGFLAVLKKPSISYLSKIPLSQLTRIIPGGGEGSE